MRLVLILCLLLLALPARADGPLASVDPERLRLAETDPWVAHEIALELAATWEEPNLRAALPLFERARDEFFRLGEIRSAAMTAVTVARVLNGLSDYRGALAQTALAEQAYNDLPRDAQTDAMRVWMLVERATTQQNLSLYEDSNRTAAAARRIAETLGDEGLVASTWWVEGINHEGLSQFDAALAAYGRALSFHTRTEGNRSLNVGFLASNIGWVYTRMGNYPEARRWQETALSIVEPQIGRFTDPTTKLRINIGLVALEEGKADEAIEWSFSVMPFIAANRTQMLSDQRWNFELLSRAFAMKGQVDRAIFFGKMAVNAQQEIRATNTVTGAHDVAASQAEWRRLYQSLADLLLSQGRVGEAQAVLNMEKEEEVFQFLRRDVTAPITQTRALLTDAEMAQEAALAALAEAPVAAERELREIMARFDSGEATEADEDRAMALQEALQAASDAFDASVAAFMAEVPEPQRAGLRAGFDAAGSYQAVLADLPRPTAILQVAALDQATHLFLTLPGLTLHREVAIPRAELARLVLDALTALEEVSPQAPERLQALHRVLFAPVSADLAEAGVEVVMLNLDGFLRYVPFAALHDGDSYLVEHYAFALYSPAVPTQFAAGVRAAEATAGFGVTKAHAGFSPLPGVKAELDTIFGDVLTGQTALDEAFDETSLRRSLLRRPGILHIASHFSLQPGREDDSFLLLGDGSRLTLSRIRETRALRFQGVDLLTLSACQTARGGDGSEIDGFGATAQLNGAAAVMASLWPVSDAATPELMRVFYAGLIEEGLDKAEALRRAQVAMLTGEGMASGPARTAEALDEPEGPQGTSHPYYWSAFVLMGNWL